MDAADVAQDQFYFSSLSDRKDLQRRYLEVRRLSEKLAAPLETEDYVVQSMEDASPTKWHLAHTTWFFETFVLPKGHAGYQSVDPRYAYLFNSYYVQAGERYPRPRRGLVTRPTVAEVYSYRRRVDEAMAALMEEADDAAILKLAPLVEIGLNHEQQHQELILTDLKHMLSFNPLFPAYCRREIPEPRPVRALAWRSFEEGMVEIGHGGTGFCFDNETPRHRCFLKSFQLADRLVTNGEYMDFMRDGGYATPTLWLNEGWQTVQEEGWKAPLYWRKADGGWLQFTLSGLRPVDASEPVCHVSQFEADAYARWAAARLPTEQEWEVVAASQPVAGNFVEDANFHPRPLAESSEASVEQLFGDVWEWTQSPYVGYPGYAPMKGALGEYNGKFMSRQTVLRGGSCATSVSHIRAAYRNFFPPTARWQFSGIRLAND